MAKFGDTQNMLISVINCYNYLLLSSFSSISSVTNIICYIGTTCRKGCLTRCEPGYCLCIFIYTLLPCSLQSWPTFGDDMNPIFPSPSVQCCLLYPLKWPLHVAISTSSNHLDPRLPSLPVPLLNSVIAIFCRPPFLMMWPK